MVEIKRSKKNVLLAFLLVCILATTLVVLHIMSASSWSIGPFYGDVAVTRIEAQNRTVVYPTWNGTLEVNVTVKDLSLYYSYIFADVAAYNGTNGVFTEFCKVEEFRIDQGAEETLSFTWNFSTVSMTWPYTVNTIKGNATLLYLVDKNETNNELVYGTVSYNWVGDSNGDGHVDEYDPLDDFNGDGVIDELDEAIQESYWHTGPLDGRDIVVTGIFPVTYPTWDPNQNLTFAVTVKNRGWEYTENFTLTIYNGTNPIDTQDVTLAPLTEEIVKFTLNYPSLPGYPDNPSDAWPYPTHTIWADATTVPNETVTEDNSYGNTTVTVRWPGDANGDGHVNQTDENIVSSFLDNQFPDPGYSAEADFNCDGIIDIIDVTIYGLNYHDGPIDYCDVALIYINVPPPDELLSSVHIAYPGWKLYINVGVKNFGNNTEDFDVTSYANSTVVDTESVTLDPGESINVSFIWNVEDISKVWPYPFYNITASASLPCDDNPANNEIPYGIVTVRWPGDTDGDGHLDDEDLSTLSHAIDSYDYNADFDSDGNIDLDDVQTLINDENWRQGPLDP